MSGTNTRKYIKEMKLSSKAATSLQTTTQNFKLLMKENLANRSDKVTRILSTLLP